MNNKVKHKLHFLLSLSLFFLSFWLIGRYTFCLDITDNKRNTLSPVSKNILRELTDTIVINYYYSSLLSDIASFPREINSFLEAYSNASPLLVYREYTQDSLSVPLKELGLQAHQISIQKYGHWEKLSYYSGIEIIYQNKRALIPFLESTQDLEYLLTTAVERLTQPFTAQVGLILLDEEEDSLQKGFKGLTEALKNYNLKPMSLKDELDIEQMPVLILIGSALLINEEYVEKLKNFIIQGGSLLLCTGGTSLDVLEEGGIVYSLSNNALILWLSSLGVLVNADLVLDPANATLLDSGETFISYPCILTLTGKDICTTSPLLKGLSRLIMPWSSSLNLQKTHHTQSQILLTSSSQGLSLRDSINAEPFYLSNYLKERLKRKPALETAAFNLACSLKIDQTLNPWQTKSNERRLVLFTSRYIFHDAILHFESQNIDLLVRCVDWLLKRDHLTGLKKEKLITTWNLSEKQKIDTHKRLMFVNCFMLPLMTLLIGLWLRLKRKKRSIER